MHKTILFSSILLTSVKVNNTEIAVGIPNLNILFARKNILTNVLD